MFLLKNFYEMNRLWARIQSIGVEAQKQQLSFLVAENIVRLSDLEGVDKEVYKTLVLPKLIELINNTNDPITEQYLTECIIQAFPDDYHLNTLYDLLNASKKLQVDINMIFNMLADRLANYAEKSKEEIIRANAFEIMQGFLDGMLEEQVHLIPLKKLVELALSLLKLAIRTYEDKVQYVDSVIGSIIKLMKLLNEKEFKGEDADSLMQLFEIPLEDLSLRIIDMPNMISLLDYLDPKFKRGIEKEVLFEIVKSKKKLKSIEDVDKVLNFIMTLIESKHKEDAYEFEEVQTSIARIVHLLECSDPQQEFTIILRLKDAFIKSGMTRMKITFPALIWSLYRLGTKAKNTEISFILSIFDLAYLLIEMITSANTESAINLLLHGAITLHSIQLKTKHAEELILQYMNKTVNIYKEGNIENNKKLELFVLISGSLNKISFIDSLSKEMMQCCSMFLKKEDQCKAILTLSHTFALEEVSLDNMVEHTKVFEGSL